MIKQNKKGFTLIELMIVITVIAILAAIALFAFTRVQRQARDARKKADMKALQTALTAFYAENGAYPTAAQGNLGCLTGGGAAPCNVVYIGTVPTAPNSSAVPVDYTYTPGGAVFALSVGLEQPAVAATPVWCIGGTQSQGREATVATCTAN